MFEDDIINNMKKQRDLRNRKNLKLKAILIKKRKEKQKNQALNKSIIEKSLKQARKNLSSLGFTQQSDLNLIQAKFQTFNEKKKCEQEGKNLQKNLQCPICLQLFINPSTTSCGHTFCYPCIQQHFLHSKKCPFCRKEVQNQDLVLAQQISELAKNLYENQSSQNFKSKRQSHKQWQKQRWIQHNDLSYESIIDVRDHNFIWCKAMIIRLFNDKCSENIQQILVTYVGRSSSSDEILSVDSHRLAPRGYFTSRTNIKKYRLSSHNHRHSSTNTSNSINRVSDGYEQILTALNSGSIHIQQYQNYVQFIIDVINNSEAYVEEIYHLAREVYLRYQEQRIQNID